MGSFKNFSFVFHQAKVKDILKYLLDLSWRYVITQITFEVNFLTPFRHFFESVIAGSINLKHSLNQNCFLRININPSGYGIIQITQWRPQRPNTISDFLSHTSGDIFSQIIHIVLTLSKSNLEHK